MRLETPADYAGIRRVHLQSFPTATEADLVDGLRADGDAVLSLVAEEDSEIAGHVLFSRMTAPFRALGLAPVAVLPHYRRRGIAARLIEDGLARAAADWDAVFVLGDPAYYGRFGFDAGLAACFANPYAGPHFMVTPLAGKLPSNQGPVAYAAAFARLG
ncbi:MAG TPA: N-acetyltransferase [Rhizomicrobium sp.]|nr:N-acetyltransferase [Rhizomicrobium sp.]